MKIQDRLEQLEKIATDTLATNRPYVACEHPASSFHIRQDYPALWTKGADGKSVLKSHPKAPRLIVKGHCDSCGYDDTLWDVRNLSPGQWDRLCDLGGYENHMYGTDTYHQYDYYAGWLIDNGYLQFVAWPPTKEIIDDVRLHGGSSDYFATENQ